MSLHAATQIPSELVKSFFVGLEGQLLAAEVDVIDASFPRQLLVQVVEFVFELQLECLQHLLDFDNLRLTVQHWFDLSSTHFLIQRGHDLLLVHLGLESRVELF